MTRPKDPSRLPGSSQNQSSAENGSKKRDRRKSKSKRTSTTSSQPNASSSAAHLKHERDSRASTGTLHDYAAFDGLTGGDSGSWLSKAQPLSRADLQEHPLADTQRGQALSDASDESFKLEDPRSSVNYGVTSSSTINHKTNGKKRALSINTSSGQESEPSSSDKSPQSATISFPSLLQNPSPTKLQTAQTSPFKRMRLDASGSASKLDSGKKDHHPTDPSRTLVECDDSNDETPLFISQPKPSPSPQPAEKKIVSPKKQPPPGPTLVIRHPSQTPPVKGTARRYTKKPESSSSDSDIEVSQISLPQPSSSQSPGKDKKTSLMSTSPRKLSHVKDMHHRPADDPLAHIFDSEEDVERLIKPSPKTKSNSKSKSVKPLDMSNGNVSSASDEETETRSTGKSLPRSKTAAFNTVQAPPSSSPQVISSSTRKAKRKSQQVSDRGDSDDFEVEITSKPNAPRIDKSRQQHRVSYASGSDGGLPDAIELARMSKSPSAKKKQVHTSKNLKSTFLDRSVKSQKPKRTRSPSGTEDEDEEEEDDLEMDFETLQSTRLRTPKVKPDRLAQLKAQREAKAERARERETTSSAVKKMQRVLDSEEEAEQKRREKKRKKAEKKRWKEREIRERKQMHDIVLDSDQENGDDSGGSSEEEEFIVDDDGDVDQEELDRLLPAQFSSMATQSDRWHHRNFIIMLVTQQLLPRDPVDNKFILSRERCKRLVQDLVDSLVRSQAWRKKFTDALKLPNMTVHDLPDTFPGCEACHMGGRKSKKVVTLSGKMYSSDPPYRPLAVNKRSGEPEDTDDDSGRGYRQSEFAIGRECLVRAQTFHELQHFEWNLWRSIKGVTDVVTQSSSSSSEDDGSEFDFKAWRFNQREKVDLVVQHMDKNDFFQHEWASLRKALERAKSNYAT